MLTAEGWAALATLTLLETVLGIDNVVFISILAGKLPEGQRAMAWRTGLGLALDVVFSLNSVITAVGMARDLAVMIAAVVISLGIMLWCAGAIGAFVNRHPTVKMLALSFLLLIGFTLVLEGCGQHVPKGYIYVAMAFSLGVELLNLKAAARAKAGAPVVLHQRFG